MRPVSSWVKYIIIAVLVLALAGAGIFFFQKKSQVITPGEAVVPTPTPAVELTTWNDPAGFSFQYPKNLTVDNNEDDDENYAHVELTNAAHPGSIIVWVSDVPKKWPPEGGMSIDTTLGGLPAKKIVTTAPVKMLSVGTISDNLLFNVEATLTDSEYWQQVHDTIVGSFAFTDTAESVPSSGGGASNSEAVDEEEVVE